MAPVYSKSFFYDTVSPGTPVSFMTGADTETWIMRDILCTGAGAETDWNVEITDESGNLVWASPVLAVNPFAAQGMRFILMPDTSYTVSTSGDNVFVSINGYVLSS